VIGTALKALKGTGKLIGEGASFFGTGVKMGEKIPPLTKFGSSLPSSTTLGVTLPAMAYGMPAMYEGGKFGLKAAYGAATRPSSVQAIRNANNEFKMLQQQAAQMKRQQMEFEGGISENIAKMAAGNPQMYNEALYGATLPQGAVVLGNKASQRTDILERLALEMQAMKPQAAPQGGAFFQDLASQPF
tara:strand:- start:275 stop:838 length:564 start_codon:yes stop_codon:yes gene_type:complete